MRTAFLFITGFFMVFPLWAQVQNGDTLGTVHLADNRLNEFSVGQTLSHLTDSTLTHNRPLLTSLLEYNTPIYFKENGLGMVSSPSFRGTTAQQTAVLWNGLNINSNLNGQTDFNTINTGSYDNIDVRAGGGSLNFGSGAIGGTVHLNNTLAFKDELTNHLSLSYGSYNTFNGQYRLKLSNNELSLRLALVRNNSDNDYKLKEQDRKNENGKYRNTAYNLALGWKINDKNQLRLYSELFDSDRHFPIFYTSETRTKYRDFNTRNMLEWRSQFGKFTSNLKTAFLTERYNYYENIERDSYSYGETEDLVAKYNLNFEPTDAILVSGNIEHAHTNGSGSDIKHEVRDITSFSLLFKHQLTDKLRYQIGGRKEVTNSYESPVLYSFGIDYDFTTFYTAKLSASKNFRRPTYNDLYWAKSGNPDLKAERSNQIELGNTFNYGNLELTVTGYFNDITHMIHWTPKSGGLFEPHNEDHVQTYGVETLLEWEKKLGRHTVKINGTYAYTRSRNRETHNQLTYVPYHKATFSAAYRYKRFSVNYQFLYNGEVFLNSDNNPDRILDNYNVSNIGLAYHFGDKHSYTIGGKVRNVLNKTYENVQRYEMPGTNYKFYLTLNI